MIVGSVSELAIRHADGTPYGALPSATVAAAQARAFRALRGLGFTERDARWAMAQIAHDCPPDAELEVLLRHALKLLTERAWRKAS